MKFSIYIPVFNQREELERTLRALIPEKDGHEVFVVDLGCSDGSMDSAKQHDWVHILTPSSHQLSTALNEAVKTGEGEGLFFLQPGSLPARGWTTALDDFLSGGADAGHLTVEEADSQSAWASCIRGLAQKIGHQILGGPASLNGVVVKRETFNNVEGFNPVPDFEWLAFANRLRQSGAIVKPVKHDVMVAPPPGYRHRDEWTELKDDFLAAWKYRKTQQFDAVRCQRKTSAAILIGYDVFPGDQPGDYFSYAQEELLKHSLEMMQSYRGVDKIYFLGKEKTMKLIGQPSGVEIVGKPRTALQKRFTELLEKLSADKMDGLLIVRAISSELTHDSLRDLCEGDGEAPCMILPEQSSDEWAALWLEQDALGALGDWELEATYPSLQATFKPKTIRQEVETGIRCLRTDSDARAMYYAGILDQLPA
jgi:glycosyltransferase involved in cell wall biosynthesis